MAPQQLTWSPSEIAALFADKRHGWKPSNEACAMIAGNLEWLFRTSLTTKVHPKAAARPVRHNTKAAAAARTLQTAITTITSDLDAIVKFNEEHTHKEVGADPVRYSIEALRELTASLNLIMPLLENPENPPPSREWRSMARAVFQILNFTALRYGRSEPLTIDKKAHVATVVRDILARAGLEGHELARIADACNDRKLKDVLVQTAGPAGFVLRWNAQF